MKWKFNPDNIIFQLDWKFADLKNEWVDNKWDDWELVNKPDEIPVSALRTGTYTIRYKGYYQEYEYWKEKDWWVEKSKITDKIVNKTEWLLFPKLSEKEYTELYKCRKYLSNIWKENLSAYLFWVELTALRRNIKKSFLKG